MESGQEKFIILGDGNRVHISWLDDLSQEEE